MRADVLVTGTRLSSSLTAAVIAMCPTPPAGRGVVDDIPQWPHSTAPGRAAPRCHRRRPLRLRDAHRSRARNGAAPRTSRPRRRRRARRRCAARPAARRALQQPEQLVRRVVVGLPGLRDEVEHDDDPRRRRWRCAAELAQQQVRDDAGEPRAGPEHDEVRLATASTASAQAGAPGGSSRTERTRPGVAAIDDWPRICRVRLGSSGSNRSASAMRSSGTGLIGSTRPTAPTSSAERGQRAVRVAARSSRPVSIRLPTGCPASTPLPPMRCCSSSAHARMRRVGAGERGQRHPQVAGRQHLQLAADPAGRAAVVGHRDDRGDVGR